MNTNLEEERKTVIIVRKFIGFSEYFIKSETRS